MQIHELTRKQPLNEVDLVGPNGLLAGIKNTMSVAKQDGGMKAIRKHLTPGTYSNIPDVQQGDFTKRMQAAKNSADMKQVTTNIQNQWEQYRNSLSTVPVTQRGNELNKWFQSKVIPPTMAPYAAQYTNPQSGPEGLAIRSALKNIQAAEGLADNERKTNQAVEFANLVAATSAMSQKITAKNPQLATAVNGGGKTSSVKVSSVQAAQTNIQKVSSVTPTQLAQIEKIMGQLPATTSHDINTTNYLHALGFNTK